MLKLLFASSLIFSSCSVLSKNLTTEELRIEAATHAMPQVLTAFADEVSQFEQQWKSLNNFKHATDLITDYSSQLWLNAKQRIVTTKNYDDRELYWARLLSSKIIRSVKPKFTLSVAEQNNLLTQLEKGSRGHNDLSFTQGSTKKIILTGFDPFLLDKNINQSNPSGVAALLLDGQVITKALALKLTPLWCPFVMPTLIKV